MKQIDLDDLPPRVAQILAGLEQGEELIVVQGGAVVARLAAGAASQPDPGEVLPELAPEEQVSEVLSQFNAMIHDEF